MIRINYKYNNKVGRILKKYNEFYNVLENERPDIIFIHGLQFYDLSTVIRYKRNYPNVILFGDNHADYVNSAHGFVSKHILHKLLWRRIIHRALPYITKCFGVTPLRCSFLKEMYNIPDSKIDFLPMGVDDDAIPQNRKIIRDEICRKEGIAQDSFIIMTGGKIDKRKNLHVLLKALKRLNNNKVHLFVCGVVAPEMEETINILKTENSHFIGWCSAESVMNYMVSSNLVCFPGTHSTLWEQSVGVGIPGIYKKWEGMTHLNVCNNCLFWDDDNEESLLAILSDLLQNITRYRDLQKQSDLAKNDFLYSKIAKKAIGIND